MGYHWVTRLGRCVTRRRCRLSTYSASSETIRLSREWRRVFLRLSPFDILFFITLAVGTVYGFAVGAPVSQFLTIVAINGAGLALATMFAVWARLLDQTLARWAFGVALTFVVYPGLTPLLSHLAARNIDEPLFQMEVAMFGMSITRWLEPIVSSELTLVFAGIYSLHVPLFYVSGLLHWRAGRRKEALRLFLSLALAMYIGFVGWALFPAFGPIGYFTDLGPIGDNAATQLVAAQGVALGTFPSLHAGISAIVAIDGWRHSTRWGVIFTIITALIWASTIYLRYHWVPDLFAGLILAIAVIWLAPRLLRMGRHW